MYQTGALEVGAEKIFQWEFMSSELLVEPPIKSWTGFVKIVKLLTSFRTRYSGVHTCHHVCTHVLYVCMYESYVLYVCTHIHDIQQRVLYIIYSRAL